MTNHQIPPIFSLPPVSLGHKKIHHRGSTNRTWRRWGFRWSHLCPIIPLRMDHPMGTSRFTCHPGPSRTIGLVWRYFYWPSLNKDVMNMFPLITNAIAIKPLISLLQVFSNHLPFQFVHGPTSPLTLLRDSLLQSYKNFIHTITGLPSCYPFQGHIFRRNSPAPHPPRLPPSWHSFQNHFKPWTTIHLHSMETVLHISGSQTMSFIWFSPTNQWMVWTS